MSEKKFDWWESAQQDPAADPDKSDKQQMAEMAVRWLKDVLSHENAKHLVEAIECREDRDSDTRWGTDTVYEVRIRMRKPRRYTGGDVTHLL